LLAGGLLLLLIGSLFGIFAIGASSWRKTEAETELGAELQKVSIAMEREVERSTYASASLDPPVGATACSLLTPVDAQGNPVMSNFGFPVWQAYRIYYFHPSSGEVRDRRLDLAAGSPEANAAEPIEFYDAGGLLPLSSFRSGGRVVASHVKQFSFVPTAGMLRVEIRAERHRYGRSAPESLHWRLSMRFRN
jgi:hypothetical protein